MSDPQGLGVAKAVNCVEDESPGHDPQVQQSPARVQAASPAECHSSSEGTAVQGKMPFKYRNSATPDVQAFGS